MPPVPSSDAPQRFTATHWLIVIMAAIGFAFDIYEVLVTPLIVRPALQEFGFQPGSGEFERWAGVLFFVPFFAGGLFGLLGGYLTDRLGRRRVLVWSILLYAVSAFAAGFSTSVEMLLVFRCTTLIGVCVEFVAAVAWLAELFPYPPQREKVLGYTQAFSSVGGLMVAGTNWLVVNYGASLVGLSIPEWMASWWGSIGPTHAHEAWRYTLISGVVPALPLILIRPFMPESPIWHQKKAEGTLKRPSIIELFRPEYRRTTIVTALMFGFAYGAAFGAIQHTPRMVPGLPEVREEVQAATKDLPAKEQKPAASKIEQKTASQVQMVQEIGGLTGRFLLALLVVRVVSRRSLIRIFQAPGLIIVPLVFAFAAVHSLSLLYGGIFLAGLFTIAQLSCWGNYLPVMYPVHLRGTGESFAANVGGRILGTSFALVTTGIVSLNPFPGQSGPTQLAWVAAGVALFVYAAGFACSFFLPEPKTEKLAE